MLEKKRNGVMQQQIEKIKLYARQSNEEVLSELHTSSSGLSEEQAINHQEQYGENKVSHGNGDTKVKQFIEAFVTPFTVVLVVLAIASFMTDWVFSAPQDRSVATTVIMLLMVIISGSMSFFQSRRSSNAVDSLMKMIQVTTNVIRQGKSFEIATEKVVVGDIISLSAGDMVPADMRLLQTKDLFASTSSLNGESAPVEKIATAKPKNNEDYLSYQNMAYSGTNIVSGSALGVVVGVGSKTVFGQIAGELSTKSKQVTAFDKGIQSTSWLLIRFMLVVAPLVFLINGLLKGSWLDALIFAIATAVGLTPEMLPVIVTSNLVKGSVEMSKHGTIMKNIDAIQNLGSATVLTTDKTGTLTQDKVVLEYHYDLNHTEKPKVLTYAYLNSYYQTGLKNLMDKAIIAEAGKELDTDQIKSDYRKIDEIPFDFKRRRMSVVVENSDDERLLVTKGAAEEMLEVSRYYEIDGEVKKLDNTMRDKILKQIESLNEDGLRVILLAYQKNPRPAGAFSVADERDLIILGNLSFLDPPKESTKQALEQLKIDGIDVKILTGDNELITRAVAKQVGLNVDKIYSGQELEDKSTDELAKIVESHNIFVKLTPAHKSMIIRQLRANGHTVAFMGDGINDAPAMKEADVGISVDTAVDIAKESADVILLKKDLKVLDTGVRLGRKVFGNTMKYIKMTSSSNFGNIFSVVFASLFLPFLPMQPLQLLLLNMIYDISCLVIPFDVMSEKYLETPRSWSTKGLKKFMFYFGPTSSVFDILTFAFLFFILGPAMLGHTYFDLNQAQQLQFMMMFNTGWFIESLWTQEMVIHALRDKRIPFIQTKASFPLMVSTIGAGIIGTIIPYLNFGKDLGFELLPISYLFFVLLMLVLYFVLVTIVKKRYLKHEDELI
ncbi:magnesium-translocating P-type ATPase [Holzapfeliella sp. JNUCC 72]